ncbi:MAG: hypothetical protein JNK82_43850 [Myxococcaceae bacterium]|nr:hypothetical protein [Myxococcaceae bacterium]
MRSLYVVVLGLVACSGGGTPTVDAGPMVDTSCGFDCAAQQKYGLIAGRCFEYSDTNVVVDPPALAAEVLAKRDVEGVEVMDVAYTRTGNPVMRDLFTIVNGELKLVRREFGASGTSVAYKDSTGKLTGVKWLTPTTGAGENFSTMTEADVIFPPAARVTTTTTYRVTTNEPTGTDLRFPIGTYDAGVRLILTETPDHGNDSRRTWVPGVGFVMLTSPLATTGPKLEYSLQKVKDTPDGGPCGF